MTIEEILAEIDAIQQTVNETVSTISVPTATGVQTGLNEVLAVWAGDAWQGLIQGGYTGFPQIHLMTHGLYVAIDDLYNANLQTVTENNYKLETALRVLYKNIVDQIESGLGVVYNEISEAEAGAENYADQIVADLEGYLEEQIIAIDNNCHAYTDLAKSTVISMLGEVQSSLSESQDSVYTELSNTIAGYYNTFSGWIDSLWDSVTAAYDYVTDKFEEYYISVTEWVNESITNLSVSLNQAMSTVSNMLNNSMDSLRSWAHEGIDSLMSLYNDVYGYVEETITSAVQEIQDLYGALENIVDWRFEFLNIFMSFPELSFLQVLNRDDETFQRFKPYWQALLSRLLEE